MSIQTTIAVSALAIGMFGCKPKGDMEQQCHDAVEHMRKVSAMPLRDGDVNMFMGACMMWKSATVDCVKAAQNDDDIKKCRDMEK
jgi:hypothetical protein